MKFLYKNWFIHNVIGHPLMQLFNMAGYEHALMCNSGWMAVAVPYKYRKPK